MLRIKRAETDALQSDDGLFPVVALLAAAAANEYLLPGGGERSRVSSSVPVTKPGQDSAPQGAVPRKSPPVNAGRLIVLKIDLVLKRGEHSRRR